MVMITAVLWCSPWKRDTEMTQSFSLLLFSPCFLENSGLVC